MADDLKKLGKRGWLTNMTKPKQDRDKALDSNIVTRYGAVPHADVEEMRRLVAIDAENLDLKDMLAFTLYSQDRLDEAMELYKELLNNRHKPAQQRLYLGNCYYRKRLYHLAVKEWEWVAAMDEASPELREKARQRVEKVKKGVAIEFGQ